MTQWMETVSLADVYPLEDEFGNVFTSRDFSLRENREYVERLAESMRAKGVPDTPIMVVPDGGIWRVKDGNSRVEAMRLLGTRSCPAIVDGDADLREMIETAARTDVKKTYEPVERSRTVQQLQLLCTDEQVAATGICTAEQSRRARRARAAVTDAAEDMTLDRLLLVDEFADDPEAVERLTSCREADADRVAASLRRERDVAAGKAAFREELGRLGVPEADETDGFRYFLRASTPDEVAGRLPREWEPGQVVARLVGCWDGARAEIYVSEELASAGESGEEAELRRMAAACSEAFDDLDAARDEWFRGNLAKGAPMPNVTCEAWGTLLEDYPALEALRGMGDDAEAAVLNAGPSPLDVAMGYESWTTVGSPLGTAVARGALRAGYEHGKASRYLDVMAVCQADGFDPGDGAALIAKLYKLHETTDEEGE